ncbi:MAG: TRAP transporter small permease [Candidatus Didemnitutus sp.]|nr:TRAP transporter small permease [Candidatus Didemnitutus sp.]
MTAAAHLWNRLCRGLEVFTIALFAILVLDVLWGVISRYVPGIRPSDWTEELAVYLLVWVSLYGAALTYRGYGHLGVDYFVSKLDLSAQRVVAVIVEIAVLLFAGFALCYGGSRLVFETLASNQLTPVLQWKIGYLYSAVPLSGGFICAFCLEHLLKLKPVGAQGAPKEI